MSNERFYFTFGADHLFTDRYLVIVAPNEAIAREYMFTKYGMKWAFCYSSDQWINEYALSGLLNKMKTLGEFHANVSSDIDTLH